ncbi:MAG TPA: hypothetical protein EYP56_08505 [Planctomycetaceae bacterium]|nr:hypothetical protein [Planctomycetaceae bacterium]
MGRKIDPNRLLPPQLAAAIDGHQVGGHQLPLPSHPVPGRTALEAHLHTPVCDPRAGPDAQRGGQHGGQGGQLDATAQVERLTSQPCEPALRRRTGPVDEAAEREFPHVRSQGKLVDTQLGFLPVHAAACVQPTESELLLAQGRQPHDQVFRLQRAIHPGRSRGGHLVELALHGTAQPPGQLELGLPTGQHGPEYLQREAFGVQPEPASRLVAGPGRRPRRSWVSRPKPPGRGLELSTALGSGRGLQHKRTGPVRRDGQGQLNPLHPPLLAVIPIHQLDRAIDHFHDGIHRP